MVRDWTTLDKKPSSVFNATVWYTDDARQPQLIKDCGSVNLTTAERCIYQRIDMTTSAKGVLTGGYLKFIIWARHNGVGPGEIASRSERGLRAPFSLWDRREELLGPAERRGSPFAV